MEGKQRNACGMHVEAAEGMQSDNDNDRRRNREPHFHALGKK